MEQTELLLCQNKRRSREENSGVTNRDRDSVSPLAIPTLVAFLSQSKTTRRSWPWGCTETVPLCTHMTGGGSCSYSPLMATLSFLPANYKTQRDCLWSKHERCWDLRKSNLIKFSMRHPNVNHHLLFLQEITKVIAQSLLGLVLPGEVINR